MAQLHIMDRDFTIAPYKIGAMRKAAPFIDRINASIGALTTVEGMTAATGDFVAVLSVGLVKIDPELTPEYLEENVGFGDLPAMRDAFLAILKESGLQLGGATAPAA